MASLRDLETEIHEIRQRNQRVETDKAWETSLTRKAVILVSTYLVVISFMLVSGLPNPFINSAIPALAFFLSTLSFPFFREMWKKHIHNG